jgi:hypothetical protein
MPSTPVPLPTDNLTYKAGEPYQQIGPTMLASNDGSIVIDNTTTLGTIDISAKVYADSVDASLDAFVVALQAAVAGSTDFASLKTAIAALTLP